MIPVAKRMLNVFLYGRRIGVLRGETRWAMSGGATPLSTLCCPSVHDVRRSWHPVGMTPEARVNVMTEHEVAERRCVLLERVGCSLYELRDRAHDYELSIEEFEILRELERLEFLVGE